MQKWEKTIYAPYCNIGMYMFDETGDYVNIPDNHLVFTQNENEN